VPVLVTTCWFPVVVMVARACTCMDASRWACSCCSAEAALRGEWSFG
jgi:hypothetical protein